VLFSGQNFLPHGTHTTRCKACQQPGRLLRPDLLSQVPVPPPGHASASANTHISGSLCITATYPLAPAQRILHVTHCESPKYPTLQPQNPKTHPLRPHLLSQVPVPPRVVPQLPADTHISGSPCITATYPLAPAQRILHVTHRESPTYPNLNP
jgi:hypothetical protein